MEKRIIEKKKKKYNWDSLLPRSGLNPGSSFLPDKGPQGWGSINHAMGDGNVTGAMAEDVEELNEASGFPRNRRQAISSCFSNNTIQAMDACSNIENSNYDDIIDLSKPSFLPSKLDPTTRALVHNANPYGQGTQSSRASRKVNHHLLGINPKTSRASNPLTEITVELPLDIHTNLHNGVFEAITQNALSNPDIQNLYDKYYDGLYNVLSPAYKDADPETQADLDKRVFELKAWFIREVWKNKNIFDLRANYSKQLCREVGEYLVHHPELVLTSNNEPVEFDGKKFYFVINTIDNLQVNELNRYLVGNKLRSYPKTLAGDFICAMSEDGKEQYSSFEDFRKAYPTLIESLLESVDNDRFKKMSIPDLTKYLENNFYNKTLVSKAETAKNSDNYFYDPYLIELIQNYFNKDVFNSLWPDLDSKVSYSIYNIVQRLWAAEPGSEVDRLKQKLIAQYVRYKLNREPYDFYYVGEPYLDTRDQTYKIRSKDLIVKPSQPGRTEEYQVDVPRDSYFPIEYFFEQIHKKNYIDINILDKHFLDESGEVVRGIKFQYQNDYGTEVIRSILRTDNCDVSAIKKIIVDKKVYTEHSIRSRGNYNESYLSSPGLTQMLADKGVKHIDEYEIIGDVLVEGMFREIDADRVTLKNFTQISFPEQCFKYAKIPTIDIPSSVRSLRKSCFAYSHLKEIFIPSTVTEIEEGCFERCSDLTVNFEVEKEMIDNTSRSKYSGTYGGYKNKWGKGDVKKITYGNSVLLDLESLKEEIQSTDDFGTNIAENNRYIIYELSNKDQFKNLNKILSDEGMSENNIKSLIGEERYWNKLYFIEDKDNIENSRTFDPNNTYWGYVLKTYGDITDWSGTSRKSIINEPFSKVLADDDLRELLLFEAPIPELADIREILNKKRITKETPYNDKKYYYSEYIDSANSLVSEDKKILKIFTHYLENGDYSSALDIADMEYPDFNNYKSNVEKALNSKEGNNIVSKLSGITVSDMINAINNSGELHDILKQSLINSLLDNLAYDTNELLSGKDLPIQADLNKQTAKVHLSKLLDERQEEKINVSNFEELAHKLIISKLKGHINNFNPKTPGYSGTSIKDNLKYRFDTRTFLKRLEDNLDYYYNL